MTNLANIGVNSSIGAGIATSDATNAASLIFNGGTLQYTGSKATIYQTTQTPTVSINRLFTLAGNGAIDSAATLATGRHGTAGAANSAALIFNNTAAVAFGTAGAKALTLQGGSTGGQRDRPPIGRQSERRRALR